MTWLEAVEVADMEPVEAAELFAQAPKLQNVRETEVALISRGAWISRARDHIGCIVCGCYSAVCSRTSDDNLARISNQKIQAGANICSL
jgi:hypothetical protein